MHAKTSVAPRSLVLILMLLCACATASNQNTSSSSGSTSTKLVKADIAATNLTSAYDVVSRLRPNWLRPPGMTITGITSGTAPAKQVLVYVDGDQLGPTETLRNLTTNNIISIEFLTVTQAASQIRDNGADIAAAVIMVRTR